MSPDLKQKIQALVDARNAPELARRKDYYEYLVQQRRTDGETLEEHIARFADFVRFGPGATDDEIAQLTERIDTQLPEALLDFYRELGGLRGQGMTIYSPAELLVSLSDTVRPYERLYSTGITDMMRHAWGNDRWEFEPKNELITQAEIDGLKSRYHCIGLHGSGDCESHTYLYFDTEGRFGTIHYHQDEFDDLLESTLRPMLEESPARLTLWEVVLQWLAMPQAGYEDDEE